jgi:phage terminase small subunit
MGIKRTLTVKQQFFIKRYVQCNGNATQAVLSVYNTNNSNSAGVIGSRLLRNVRIHEALATRLESEESFTVYMVMLLKKIIDNGTGSEKIRALEIALKLHGLL